MNCVFSSNKYFLIISGDEPFNGNSTDISDAGGEISIVEELISSTHLLTTSLLSFLNCKYGFDLLTTFVSE